MITVILVTIVVFLFTVIASDDDWAGKLANGIVAIIPGALFGILIALIISIMLPKVPKELPPQALYSLSDGSQMSGHFFLGSGSFEGKQVIFYAKKDPTTGVITFHHLDKERVGIVEDNPETPYLQSWGAAYAGGSWVENFAFDCPQSNVGNIPLFHIPAGSVKQGYNIQ